MSTCSHGKDLSTQVCKYCSCTHGNVRENCAACSGIVHAKHGPILNPAPATPAPQTCVHGIEMNRLCAKCMAAGALGTSGSFTARMPDTFGMSPEAKRQHEQAQRYKRKLADMEKVPGAMRMFRTWTLNDKDELRAMVATYQWRKGENTATSMAEGGTTGFFGFASLAELQRQEKKWWELSQNGQPHSQRPSYHMMGLDTQPATMQWFVSGTFLAYGHMVIAEHGGRSQFAVPEYIIEPDGSDPDFSMRILAVAEKYGMQLISVATAGELKVGTVPWWRGKPIQ